MEAVSLCNVYLFLRTHSALGLLCFNQDETLLGWKCTVFQLGWNGVRSEHWTGIGMKQCWDELVLGWTCTGMTCLVTWSAVQRKWKRNQLRGASKPAFVRIRYSLSPTLYSVKIKVPYVTSGTKSAKSLWFTCSP